MFGLGTKTKELEKSFARLGKILDAMDMPVWQRDESHNIIFCNNAYLKLSETPEGKEDINELSKEIATLSEEAKKGNKTQIKRLKIVSEGERQEFQDKEIPTNSGTIGYARNMEDLVKAEEDLKSNETVQKQLLESSASAIAIYGADQKLKFFNNAFMNLWKLEESWLGTEPTYAEVLETLREKRRLPEQANFLAFKKSNLQMFNSLMETKEDFYFLPDERSLRVIMIPHALGGLQIVYEDMTDKLALERSYNTLLDVQSETLANLHEGVAVFGENGKLTLNNPVYAGIWGLNSTFLDSEPFLADILEKTKDLYSYGDSWESYKEEMVAKLLGRERISENLELSSGVVMDIKTVPLPDGEILVTYNDITDSFLVEKSLREANEALEDVDKLKTEFLANISYELRSPLTSIIGFTEVMRQEIFGKLNKNQKNYLEDIYNASRQLEALINDILDISTIEAGYMKLNADRFDLHAMLAAVTGLIKERISEHNLKFNFDCSPKIGKMFGDETRMKQVVFNILSNSIKFTESGGKIQLGAEKIEDDKIMIFVVDNGEGISEEEMQSIFNKFQKTKSKGGTGLGLSVAKNFVELHGGEIKVESEVGKGTRVELILPRENSNLVSEHQEVVI